MKYLTFLLFLPALTGCYDKRPAEKTGHEGKSLPSFSLLLPDSTTYFNTSNITAGKASVLFYFGPNCPYSRAQMDDIIQNMNKLKDIQFYILTSSPFSQMKGFYEYYRLEKYQNIVIGYDFKHYFKNYFEIQAVPYLAIYGKNKKLNEAFIGKMYASQIIKVANK